MVSSKHGRARALVTTFLGSASRLTLSASLGLAGLSVLPATGWAACSIAGDDIQCGTTVTTDTVHAGILTLSDDRAYEGIFSGPLLLTVDPGAAVSGYGLAITNRLAGITVVNNGAISVDAGNTPTAGGSDAALYIAAGLGFGLGVGDISYSGDGSITNNGTGDGLNVRQANLGSIVLTLGGDVIATTGSGIDAEITSLLGGDLTINAANVTGGGYGVRAFNGGTGDTSVTVGGLASGGDAGILAVNGFTAANLTVNANNVTARSMGGLVVAGVLADNQGTGSTLVNVGGTVDAGGAVASILARNDENAGSLTVTTSGTVSGGTIYGIVAANGGSGATAVTATGDVTSAGIGIVAANGLYDIGDLLDGVLDIQDVGGTSLTIDATNVAGGAAGIYAANQGSGPTGITATGLVQGELYGVFAASLANGDMTINLADVTATGGLGVFAVNAGGGAVDVNVTGTIRAGVSGVQVVGGGDVDVNVVDVIATEDYSIGIAVSQGGAGTGNTTVTSTGLVQASISGILIDSGGGDVVVNANTVALTRPDIGGGGIDVHNYGFGSSTVTATGSVDGGDVGIGVYNDSDATSVTVNAASASGSLYGILVWNDGSGPTSITSSGTVLGGDAGISVDTLSAAPTTIVNNGTLANLDRLPTSVAVEAFGGAVDFTNNGTLLGTVYFDGSVSSLTNAGLWYVPGGTSAFGAGANSLVNLVGGTIVAGTTDGTTATTVFDAVGSFTNRGTFTMAGGAAGDRASLTGNASFEAGSTYAVDIDAAGAADLLTVNGTVTLLAGATLDVNAQGALIDGTRYTVLTATDGLTGMFDFTTGGTAFLAIEDLYDANNVYLQFSQYRSFESAGLTPNQIATATGLQSLPAGNALFNAILSLPTDAQARAAFDSLSGEIGASAKGVLIGDSQFLRGVVFDRLTSAGSSTPAGGISVAPLGYAAQPKSNVPYPTKAEPAVAVVPESAIWAQGFGSWGSSDGNANAASIDRNTGGFFIGADTLVGNGWRLGVLGGYSQTSFDVDGRASSGESDNFHIGAYAGTSWGAVNFRAGASYTWNDISTSRNVFIPDAQLLQADYDAGTAQVFGELGYGLTFGAVDFEPFVGLAYVNLNTDGFTETGGIAALSSASDSTDATYSTLGLRASINFALGSLNATAKGMLGWRHAFGDVTPTTAYQFAAGSSPFSVDGVPIAEDAALVEVGLDMQLLPTATFGIAYGGEFGDGATDQSFTANLSVKF